MPAPAFNLKEISKNGLSRHLITFPSDYQHIKW